MPCQYNPANASNLYFFYLPRHYIIVATEKWLNDSAGDKTNTSKITLFDSENIPFVASHIMHKHFSLYQLSCGDKAREYQTDCCVFSIS
jgi:hypothetical protein